MKWILKSGLTERLLYLSLNLGWLIKWLFYLDLNGRYPRGFSISILNYDDQGASLPWFEWKVSKGLLYLGTWAMATKGLLYLDLWWKVTKGLLYLRTWILVTNRLLYLDLWWKVTKEFLYLRTWDFACKRLKFWIRLFDGEYICYSVVLSYVIFICSFLIWIFSFLTKKALINFCSPLKNILTLKFET